MTLKKYSDKFKNIRAPGIFIVALMFSNFFNLVFNAYLGRALSFSEFANITVINSLLYFVGIFANSLYTTTNHKVSFLKGQRLNTASFAAQITKPLLKGILLVTLIWVLLLPYTKEYFNLSNNLILLTFTPILLFFPLGSVYKGFLQGNLFFKLMSVIVLSESICKLLIAITLEKLGFHNIVYLSIPISIFISFTITILAAKFVSHKDTYINLQTKTKFPFKFYFVSTLTAISSITFLSVDVLLAKHFLNETDAGRYAILSLVGKILYFLGSTFNSLIITFVSKAEGEHKSTSSTFYKMFGASLLVTGIAYIILTTQRHLLLPIIFGSKTLSIIDFIPEYGFAIVLFTLASVIVMYHLAKEHYRYSLISFFSAFLLIAMIYINHFDIKAIISSLQISSVVVFLVTAIWHILPEQKFFIRAYQDFNLLLTEPKTNYLDNATGKKVLVLNWRDTAHKHSGGAEVYVHEIFKRWVQDGIKVTLFCGNDGLSKNYEITAGIEIYRRGGFYLIYLWAMLYYLKVFRNRYDLIVDCENGIPFFTPLFVRKPVICVVHHIHSDFLLNFVKYNPFSYIVYVLERFFMPIIYRSAKFVAVSNSTKQGLLNLGIKKENIEIVNNGVNLDFYRPGEKSPTPLILYLGRVEKYKSLEILIHAFSRIYQHDKSTRLVIAGSGNNIEKLFKLTLDLKISGVVTFLGRVTEETKLKLLQSAWVFVNPSFIEGWGITSIEANACGTPVVASNVPGLRDSVKNPHTGYLVEYGNVDKFTEKINDILGNEKTRQYMQEESIFWANNFKWSKSAAKLHELIVTMHMPLSQNNLLFVGNYGNYNIGDDAILQSISKKYKKLYSDYNQYAFVRNQDHDTRLYSFANPVDIQIKKVISIIIKSKLVVIGGGGLIGVGSGPYARYIPAIAIISKLLGKKIYYDSVGIYDDAKIALKILTYLSILFADKCIVRDIVSYNHLVKIPFVGKKIIIGDDIVICDNSNSDFEIEGLGLEERLKVIKANGSSVILGINFIPMHSHKNYILLYTELKKYIKHIINDPNKYVLLLPFCNNKHINNEDDYYYSKELTKELGQHSNLLCVDTYTTPQTMKNILKYCNSLILMRFHAMIFANKLKIPYKAIIASQKTSELSNRFDGKYINLDNIDVHSLQKFFQDKV